MNSHPIDIMIAADAKLYRRECDLPKLIAVWPRETEDYSVAGREHIIERLEKVSAALGRLGEQEHWSYDLMRHIAVLGALKAERDQLSNLISASNDNINLLGEIVGKVAEHA